MEPELDRFPERLIPCELSCPKSITRCSPAPTLSEDRFCKVPASRTVGVVADGAGTTGVVLTGGSEISGAELPESGTGVGVGTLGIEASWA